MSNVIDWSDIKKSVEAELGGQNRGWVRIVTRWLEKVKMRCDEKELSYPDVFQIKQKFAQLRLYYRDLNKDGCIQSYIAAAHTEADASCERCGNSCQPQTIGGWSSNLCCWCAHQLAEERGQKPIFNKGTGPEDGHLQCVSCGYIGQIAWKATGYRCPACVSKGLG
jgi:hypothetical protein